MSILCRMACVILACKAARSTTKLFGIGPALEHACTPFPKKNKRLLWTWATVLSLAILNPSEFCHPVIWFGLVWFHGRRFVFIHPNYQVEEAKDTCEQRPSFLHHYNHRSPAGPKKKKKGLNGRPVVSAVTASVSALFTFISCCSSAGEHAVYRRRLMCSRRNSRGQKIKDGRISAPNPSLILS